MSEKDPLGIFKNWNYLFVAAVAVIALLIVWSAVQILDVYAPTSRRWAVVEGEKFQFTGFHHFTDGTIEKVDVTCVANGMPVEPTQAVEMTCTPLNVYGHTETLFPTTDDESMIHDAGARRGR